MMLRRAIIFGVLVLLGATGCSLGEVVKPVLTETAVPSPLMAASPTPSISQATDTPSPVPPSVTPPPPPTNTPLPPSPDLSLSQNQVLLYPSPQIYAGDKITFQILPFVPDSIDPGAVSLAVYVDGKPIGSGSINEQNLAGEAFGLVKWAWDTTDLAGNHLVQIILDPRDTIQIGDENPDNNHVTLSVNVLDRVLLPEAEANATWVTANTACCQVYVVSGTAAYRDLTQLLSIVETAVNQAATRLGEQLNQPLDVYFVDRIIGQGGYAGSSLVVSYTDRDYAGIALHQVLVHESVHVIDRQFAPQRIAFLAEGLAVWASDGHYKPEDIDQQAAALLSLGQYVPIVALVNDFYPVQHEIGYLQAASFVKFLIDNHGWSRFRDFYTDVTADDAPTVAEALDSNLQIYYSKNLAEMEREWLTYLSRLPGGKTAVADLQTTIYQYETMRRYQRLYDPTAYFLNAWLPYPHEVRASGSPADLTRRPQSETNITLEVMLQAASESLNDGRYNQANVILASVERVLKSDGLFQDPLAISYRDIIRLAVAEGYHVQKVELSGDRAKIWVTDFRSTIITRHDLVLDGPNWTLSN